MKFTLSISGRADRTTLYDLIRFADSMNGSIETYQISTEDFDVDIVCELTGSFSGWEEVYAENLGIGELEHIYVRIYKGLVPGLTIEQRMAIMDILNTVPALSYCKTTHSTLNDAQDKFIREALTKHKLFLSAWTLNRISYLNKSF